jgi:phage terminase small subunit
MNAKQKRFAHEFHVDHNATAAAIRTGYAEGTARQQGSRLLANPAVKQLVAKLDAKKTDELGIDAHWIAERLVQVFEKSFEGSPRVWKGLAITVEVDGEAVIVTEWSPSGANNALMGLAKIIGATVDRTAVERTGEVVYTLTLDRDLSEGAGE